MYYFLRQDLFSSENIIEIVGHTDVTGQYGWTDGKKFESDIPLQTLKLDPAYGQKMPDFFDTTVPVMSDKLLSALKEAGVEDIDTYPVILKRKDNGQEWDSYKMVNVVGSLDAIDREESKCEETEIGSLECDSITIDPSVAGEAKCFRLAEGPGLIVISQGVADILKKYDFSAVLIQPTVEYNGD